MKANISPSELFYTYANVTYRIPHEPMDILQDVIKTHKEEMQMVRNREIEEISKLSLSSPVKKSKPFSRKFYFANMLEQIENICLDIKTAVDFCHEKQTAYKESKIDFLDGNAFKYIDDNNKNIAQHLNNAIKLLETISCQAPVKQTLAELSSIGKILSPMRQTLRYVSSRHSASGYGGRRKKIVLEQLSDCTFRLTKLLKIADKYAIEFVYECTVIYGLKPSDELVMGSLSQFTRSLERYLQKYRRAGNNSRKKGRPIIAQGIQK